MSDIDFSNEGLSARVESEGDEVGIEEAVENPVEDSAADAGEPVEEAPVGDAPAEDESEPDDAEVDEPVAADPEEETYRQRYENLVSKLGEQGQEVGTLRQQLAELQARLESQPEPVEQPVFPGRVPTSAHELYEMAATPEESVDAYNFAIEKAPEHALHVINEVAQHDPVLADEMRAHYYQQAQQPAEPAIPQDMAQWWEAQRQAAVVEQIASTIDGFDTMREEIARIVEEEPDLMGDGSPDAIAKGLRWAARMAQQVRDNATAQVQQQTREESQQRRREAVVETGTPASAPEPVEHTEADSIRGAIFAQDKARADLF